MCSHLNVFYAKTAKKYFALDTNSKVIAPPTKLSYWLRTVPGKHSINMDAATNIEQKSR